jgi:hypothetical protein
MPIVVVGMHRSGTSMLSRLLNIAGMYLGDEEEMYPAKDSNPKGHWEHTGFLDINERIFVLFGADWGSVPLYPSDWLDLPDIRVFKEEASAFVANTFTDKPVWGWKEPRTTLTLPFWRQVVPDIRFVICVRNPLDVAASLLTRNQFPVALGTALWHVYTAAALKETRPEERIFAVFNDFFTDYHAALDPILEFLNLPPLKKGSAQDEEAAHFIDAGLNHHRHSLEDVLTSAEVAQQTKQLYETLLRSPEAATALCRTPEEEAFQKHQAEFLWIEGNKRRNRETERVIEHLRSQLNDYRTQIGELQAVLNLPSHRAADNLSRTLHRLPALLRRKPR